MGQVIPMPVNRAWSGSNSGAQAWRSEVDRRVKRWRWRRALEARAPLLLDVALVAGASAFAAWALRRGQGQHLVLSIVLLLGAIRRAWRALP